MPFNSADYEVNSTTDSTTEDSNFTTVATTVLITEMISTTFSSDSEDVNVHIQVWCSGSILLPGFGFLKVV